MREGDEKQRDSSYETSHDYVDLVRNRMQKWRGGHEILSGRGLAEQGVLIPPDPNAWYVVQKLNQRQRDALARTELTPPEQKTRDIHSEEDWLTLRLPKDPGARGGVRFGLHRDFAERIAGDEADVIAFADRFGIGGFGGPHWCKGFDVLSPVKLDTGEPYYDHTHVTIVVAPLEAMRSEARSIGVLTEALVRPRNLSEQSYERAFNSLRDFLNRSGGPKDAVMDASIPSDEEERTKLLTSKARTILAQQVKRTLGVHLDEKRTPAFEVHDVRSAIYLSLLDELHSGRVVYRVCKQCGWAFEVKDKRHEFCSGRTCRDGNYNQSHWE